MVVFYSTCSLWPTKVSYMETEIQNYVGCYLWLVGPLFYSHSVWEIFWEVNYENHWICINNWIYFIFSKLQSRHINKNKCMYCCYENEFRLHSRLPCSIWTFRVQNTTELICNAFLVLVFNLQMRVWQIYFYFSENKNCIAVIFWNIQ